MLILPIWWHFLKEKIQFLPVDAFSLRIIESEQEPLKMCFKRVNMKPPTLILRATLLLLLLYRIGKMHSDVI